MAVLFSPSISSELWPFGHGWQELAAPDIWRCNRSFPSLFGHGDAQRLHDGKLAVSSSLHIDPTTGLGSDNVSCGSAIAPIPPARGEFRPRQTRQLPRAVDLKGRVLSCQSY